MISLCYVSTACEQMSDKGLKNILSVARSTNADMGITGMLLYKDMSFLQVLEGNKESVHSLYRIIAKDARHCDLKIVFENNLSEREFPDWSMGFQNLDKEDLTCLDGYNQFMTDNPNGQVRMFFEDLTLAKRVLLFFRCTS